MAKIPVEKTLADGNNDGMREVLYNTPEIQPFFDFCEADWLG
jgi:hypothetical protein